MKAFLSGSKKLPRSLLFFSALLAVLLITVWAQAEQATLVWDANTESDLAGYKIHYGTASNRYSVHIDVRKVTTYTVTGLEAGQTYYFAATAYDTSGNESGYSNQVVHSVPAANSAPTTPAVPAGPSTSMVNTDIAFITSATDPNGHSIEYRYDWGGGSLSSWGAAAQSHSWPMAGTYTVKAQARDSLGAESAWSGGKTVAIAHPAPIIADSGGEGAADIPDAGPNSSEERAEANGNGIGGNADAPSAQSQAPDAPVPISPVNEEAVSTVAVLKTSPFRSAAAGAVHALTRWQVFRDEDDVCVLDVQSAVALISLTVPKLVLDEGTAYFWRAQFVDSDGKASSWSDYEYFVTIATESDLNANGIPDAQEVGSAVDLDRDGLEDNEQRTIKSVKMEGTAVQIGVSIKGCPTAIAVEAVESEDPHRPCVYVADKPQRMPFGLINFKIAVAEPGDSATVTLHFSEPAPVKSQWYKYDPIAERWVDFSAYARFAADRRSMTLNLRDGGAGDADGVANGVIVDPAGIVEVTDAQVSSGGGTDGGGGGGGCFIVAAKAGGGSGGGWLLPGLISVAGLALRARRRPGGN